jgi:hypothetical protein
VVVEVWEACNKFGVSDLVETAGSGMGF